jgi:hypothetical protein
MHYSLESIPPEADFDGMAISHTCVPKGFDLNQLLEGLPGNLCPCPHWGYLLEGRVIVRYEDGSEEEIKAGDVYYTRPGHTAVMEEDCVSIDFSPIGPWRQLMEHIAAKVPAADQRPSSGCAAPDV